MHRRLHEVAAAVALALAAAGSAMAAQESASTDPDLEEVVVYGRGERLIGEARAASEGTVGGADLGVRPLLRVAELLEVVPGLIAAQHSGSGKANQYFLRGFNLDHGTDFAAFVDGVPMNLRTHGHGQGYLDVNGLIPELIERIDFRKGPYRADLGDNALAGASFLHTVPRFAAPFASVEAGEYGWLRAAAGGSHMLGNGELTAAAQWKTYDGPWQLSEDLKHVSTYLKYAEATGFGRWEASLASYDASWRPTEQIPERAIGTSVCADAFCALDTSATGDTQRHIATLRLTGSDWGATVYGQYYNWNMYSDSTYDFQIRQWDKRFIYGARGQKSLQLLPKLQLTTGGAARRHPQGAGRPHAAAPVRGLRGSAPGTRTVAGRFCRGKLEARGRRARDGRTARRPLRLPHARHAAGIPRRSCQRFRPVAEARAPGSGDLDTVEAYANWGRGFHSNDSRGVTASVPAVPGLVKGTGEELGARYQRGAFSFTATYWWLEVDSELKFVGDSNSVEPGASSRRRGYELVSFWRPFPQLAIDASFTVSRARYFGALAAPGETHIAGAIESAGELGVSRTSMGRGKFRPGCVHRVPTRWSRMTQSGPAPKRPSTCAPPGSAARGCSTANC
ncbi:MAG: TonB-dependent receptor plug domain-containing protein [Proteobacteria bacterium]|nr:TonB-dependent receptor plug domain-containing protein [Pseudomonadota bacterium]